MNDVVFLETSTNIIDTEKLINKLGLKLYKKKIKLIPIDDEWEEQNRNYEIQSSDLEKLKDIVAKIPKEMCVRLTYAENNELISTNFVDEEYDNEMPSFLKMIETKPEEKTKEEEEIIEEVQKGEEEDNLEAEKIEETVKEEEEEEIEEINYTEEERNRILNYFMGIIRFETDQQSIAEGFLKEAKYNIHKAVALYMKFTFPELCNDK